MSNAEELAHKASAEFGDAAQYCVTYKWLHYNWSETKDSPSASKAGKKLKKLWHDVEEILKKLSPPSNPSQSSGNQSSGSPSTHEGYQPDRASNERRQALVDRLMENTAAPLPDSCSWHTPLNYMDEWVHELHKAVDASPVCSWEPGMTTKFQCIQSLGLSTLSYGYCFKFRFQDEGQGDLFYHGTPVGCVFEILRRNFRPRRCPKGVHDLQSRYGCVPPMVWFSQLYSCAARYPIHKWKSEFALGEPLAHDAPQPMRAIFHARVNKSEWLHKHVKGSNNQFAFSPESVLSIVGLDIIATCFSAESVMHPIWPTERLGDYMDVDVLEAKLRELQETIALPTHEPPWVPTDPRHEHRTLPSDKKYRLITDSPEEIARLANLVKKRDELLEDQRQLVALRATIQRDDGQWTLDSTIQLVQGLPKHLRDLLRDCKSETPEGPSSILEDALGRLSEQLERKEVAGSQAAHQHALHRIKKYKQRLRKAKALTEKCEVYEPPDPDPIVAPPITKPAGITKRLPRWDYQDGITKMGLA